MAERPPARHSHRGSWEGGHRDDDYRGYEDDRYGDNRYRDDRYQGYRDDDHGDHRGADYQDAGYRDRRDWADESRAGWAGRRSCRPGSRCSGC